MTRGQRNKAIITEYTQGISTTSIAEKYALSPRRVQQLVKSIKRQTPTIMAGTQKQLTGFQGQENYQQPHVIHVPAKDFKDERISELKELLRKYEEKNEKLLEKIEKLKEEKDSLSLELRHKDKEHALNLKELESEKKSGLGSIAETIKANPMLAEVGLKLGSVLIERLFPQGNNTNQIAQNSTQKDESLLQIENFWNALSPEGKILLYNFNVLAYKHFQNGEANMKYFIESVLNHEIPPQQ
jgi:hypothetical protein